MPWLRNEFNLLLYRYFDHVRCESEWPDALPQNELSGLYQQAILAFVYAFPHECERCEAGNRTLSRGHGQQPAQSHSTSTHAQGRGYLISLACGPSTVTRFPRVALCIISFVYRKMIYRQYTKVHSPWLLREVCFYSFFAESDKCDARERPLPTTFTRNFPLMRRAQTHETFKTRIFNLLP